MGRTRQGDGWPPLIGGFEVVSLFMGLFGVAEIIDSIDTQRQAVLMGKLRRRRVLPEEKHEKRRARVSGVAAGRKMA